MFELQILQPVLYEIFSFVESRTWFQDIQNTRDLYWKVPSPPEEISIYVDENCLSVASYCGSHASLYTKEINSDYVPDSGLKCFYSSGEAAKFTLKSGHIRAIQDLLRSNPVPFLSYLRMIGRESGILIPMRNSTLFIDFIPEFNDIKKRFDEIEKYQNICTIEIESVVDRDMIGIIYDDSKKGVISNQLKIEFLNLGMCITPLGMTNSIYCLGGRTTGKMENFTIASWLLNVATSHLNEKDILEIRMQDLSRPVAFFSDRNRDKVILLMPSWLH